MTEQAAPLSLGAMRRALSAHAEQSRVPVSLELLCRFAGVRWKAATAVSVPVGVAGAGRAQTVAAGDLARTVEELQITLGEGPSLDVLAGAGPIHVDDLDDGAPVAQWPAWTPAAVDVSIASLSVMPMRVGAARFGAFSVYLQQPGGLDATAGTEAIAMASLALDLLLQHLGSSSVDGVVDDRPEIHQATGMVSIQLGVDLPTALLRLRARAFAENRRLSHLAADVVSRVVRFTEEPLADAGGLGE